MSAQEIRNAIDGIINGWREQERRARKARARWVAVGIWLVIATSAGIWFEALRWALA